MSEAAVTQRGTRAPGDYRAVAPADWPAPDARRRLQLALGALWLLDAILQYQPVMFTRAFSQMLAAAAPGNPAFVSLPILWNAHLVGQHPMALNAAFATIQLLLALGIAWRPTVRVALGASIVWALGVWWFGEGLGGVLTGAASPVSGAPGPAILYALLAVLLWPRDRVGLLRAPPVRRSRSSQPGPWVPPPRERSGSSCGPAWPISRCCPRTAPRRRCTPCFPA